MENKTEDNNQEKIDKNLILFDKGFNDIQELSIRRKLDQTTKKRKPINWYTLYIILFKNTLSSKRLIPNEELKLRLNIFREKLPPFYNVPKSTENLNSNSLLKKFTYHVYSKNNFLKRLLEKNQKRSSIFLFEEGEQKEKESNDNKNHIFTRRIKKTKTQKFSSSNINLFNFGQRRGSLKKQSPHDLNVINEYSPKRNSKIFQNFTKIESQDRRKLIKRSTIKYEGPMINKLLFSQKKKNNSGLFFYELEKKAKLNLDKKNELDELNKIDRDILIRTPKDNEYSLVLSDKRNMEKDQTYFHEYLNKINTETKNEKNNTYKKEVATQLLKFNDLCFDSKLDDFGNDKVFSEIKNNCDLFINLFNLDKQEEKNINDLDKFL